MNNKNNLLIYLCVALFGIAGIYLTFISSNINKYDSQTTAYRIYSNEVIDTDGTLYYPIYYFEVNGKEYECEAKSGSNYRPKESKNKVYYDSDNPEKCQTEYEKHTNKFVGIICLIISVLVAVLALKKPSKKINESNQTEEFDIKTQFQDEETAQKINMFFEKAQIMYKKIVLVIIIIVLLVLILFDTAIVKQTIKAKDYIETTATYVDKKNEEGTIFDDYIYTFKDKQGNQQEIVLSTSKDEIVKDEIKIKYNENNPQDYYGEGSTLDKLGVIWYIVKIIALIISIILLFNENILNKINLSIKKS